MARVTLACSSSVACWPAQYFRACVRRGSLPPADRYSGKLPVLTRTNLVGAHTGDDGVDRFYSALGWAGDLGGLFRARSSSSRHGRLIRRLILGSQAPRSAMPSPPPLRGQADRDLAFFFRCGAVTADAVR